jgi:hypothetical protein
MSPESGQGRSRVCSGATEPNLFALAQRSHNTSQQTVPGPRQVKDIHTVRLVLEMLAAVLRTVIGSLCLSFTLPAWNRVTVLALAPLTSLSLGQARQGSFRGFSNDELARVEKAAAAGSPAVAPAFTIDMPIDHFNESDHRTYKNRYWVNATYYMEGGPVFL